jgi:hypothetical protein
LQRAAPEFAAELISAIRELGACNNILSVYVVALSSGYYVLARDAAGQLQDRMAPDIATVAALVASWSETVADSNKAVPAIDDPENPVPAQGLAATKSSVPSTKPAAFGTVSLLATAGALQSDFSSAAVDVTLDLARVGDAVMSIGLGYQLDLRNNAVRTSDDVIKGFVTQQVGAWAKASLRHPLTSFASLAAFADLGVGAMFRRRVDAVAEPGTRVRYKQFTGAGLRVDAGLQAGVSLDPHVQFFGSLGLMLSADSTVTATAQIGYLAGAGVRYTP